ncbi:TetR/AcrR family transcriptional regulator [Pollutimonas bauzanensis]|uniref:Transcriptional regulator, TetR family n=1 Tax=Pollutimonas bauzanensis TaxID=658167 RepID=A0A1M5NHD3_9BURK|nr:TetR/AcrR family transcriptional regulator [Pollutimonas bauzanensis]SHG88986.1 transcriptional regulator, TetR family [Pollutimonas bauzanensis]
MARPTESAPSARERILSCASALFYQKGINNVGINEIIAGSDIARMTLYHHFKSKDDIVSAVLQQRMEQRQAGLLAAMRRPRTAGNKILAAFDYLASIIGAKDFRGCAFINATVELANPAHPGATLAALHKRWMTLQFEQVAREAHWRDPALFGLQCQLLWDGAVAAAQVMRSGQPARAARLAAAALIAAAQA